eukprot:gb/GFBE01001081.1/.p1 GENE.gb/GFBE01001081.1/~~gb/GFBE01001081.1/.p1  ORF type:complete len:339 (+),score=59.36 gb/GFBE01001081.1/:1-1017(+)
MASRSRKRVYPRSFMLWARHYISEDGDEVSSHMTHITMKDSSEIQFVCPAPAGRFLKSERKGAPRSIGKKASKDRPEAATSDRTAATARRLAEMALESCSPTAVNLEVAELVDAVSVCLRQKSNEMSDAMMGAQPCSEAMGPLGISLWQPVPLAPGCWEGQRVAASQLRADAPEFVPLNSSQFAGAPMCCVAVELKAQHEEDAEEVVPQHQASKVLKRPPAYGSESSEEETRTGSEDCVSTDCTEEPAARRGGPALPTAHQVPPELYTPDCPSLLARPVAKPPGCSRAAKFLAIAIASLLVFMYIRMFQVNQAPAVKVGSLSGMGRAHAKQQQRAKDL